VTRILGAFLLVASLAASACGSDAPPIPELASVPEFRLVDQSGAPFGSAELRGKIWVANFVFTTCPTVCPLLTTQMRNVQQRVGAQPNVRFVSFSVDPTRDTPEVLRAYAATHDADLSTWHFLTGETEAVRSAVVDGMRVGMGERGADGDILHGTHFVLVDGNARIRGYYRNDRDGMDGLVRDVARLASE
jgi:protein SCO1/2